MSKVYLCKTSYQLLSAISDPASFHLVYEDIDATIDPGALGDTVMANWHAAGTGAVQAPEWYLSSEVNPGVGEVSVGVYDITGHLDGSPHGSPVHVSVGTRAITGTAGTNLPTGCAGVVSYRAAYGTDVEFGSGSRPRARDRNRFYFGPLGPGAVDTESVTNRTELKVAFQTDMLKWLTTVAAVITIGGHFADLRVWSRKNASIKPCLTAWMDNRIDYQRRRADQGLARQVLAF